MLDTRFEKLVAESQAAVMIFGDARLHEFQFLELGTAEVETVESLTNQGWAFAGVIGVDANGETKTALNIPFDRTVMSRICDAFTERVKSEWFAIEMKRMVALPDTRPDRTVN